MSTRKKIIVCPNCGGRGVTTNPNIYPVGGGFTQNEWDEMDSEYQDMYMDGAYDVRCRECNGRNVIEIEIRTDCVVCEECKPESEHITNHWMLRNNEYKMESEFVITQ